MKVSIPPENRTSAKPGLDSDLCSEAHPNKLHFISHDISRRSAALKFSNHFKRPDSNFCKAILNCSV